MKTILLTGGSGFIGSHACIDLLANGYRVISLDSNVNSLPLLEGKLNSILGNKVDLNNQYYFQRGDIRDKSLMRKIFKNAENSGHPIKAVIHFAGLKAVSDSVIDPLNYWENNVFGSLCLLQVMSEFDCKTIVFSSSAVVYGNSSEIPIKEQSIIEPHNPYGHTKAAIEVMLSNVSKSDKSNWRIGNLRYFNPIGAHDSGLIGENPLNKPNNIFPIICNVAKRKIPFLKIFGNDWPTIDGTGIRDYVHVMDLAESHRVSIEFLMKNKPQIFSLNIGTGFGTSVLELVKTFSTINNCEIPYRFFPRRDGDVAISIANNEKAYHFLKWQPKRVLEDMCRDGWNWAKNN